MINRMGKSSSRIIRREFRHDGQHAVEMAGPNGTLPAMRRGGASDPQFPAAAVHFVHRRCEKDAHSSRCREGAIFREVAGIPVEVFSRGKLQRVDEQ